MKIPPQTFSTLSHTVSSGIRVFFAVLLVAMPLASVLLQNDAYAAGITPRTVILQPGSGGDGGSLPDGTVDHRFEFTLPTTGTLGSITFEYCDKAGPSASFPNCTRPAGISTTSATFTNGSGPAFVNINPIQTDPVNNAVDNGVILDRVPASGGGATVITLNDVVNPSAENTTFFIWIKSYASDDGTGSIVDEGTVAASTTSDGGITVTGRMPESLVFCTGGSVDTNPGGGVGVPGSGTPVTADGGIPDCSTATAGAVVFDKLFSPTDTAVTHSQMAASTNADNGYVITYQGTTLLNGSTPIPEIGAVAEASAPSTGQFGINLVANTTPASGMDIDEASDGTNLKAAALSPYNTADQFAFVANSAEDIASSSNGGAGPSNSQIMTVTYMVNVPGNQPAGVYQTTITYVCTAYF